MLALESGAVLELEPGIVLHSLPDQNWFYAFNVNTGDQYQLNQTSFWVLETIGEGIEWDQLKETFLENFEVDTQTGGKDLRELVDEFRKEKIVGRRDHGQEKEGV